MIMKLIGLDVDGVLNNCFTKERLDGFVFVSDEKIELLKQLIVRTGAKVLLTSTWSSGWADLEEGLRSNAVEHFIALRDKLLEFGVELMDYTPITNGGRSRHGEEIEMWMKAEIISQSGI